MFGSQKIISAKQMTASKYKRTIGDMLEKGGKGIFRTKFEQNKFAKEVRAQSQAHHGSLDKKQAEEFVAGMYNNKKDNIRDRTVKKIASAMGLSESNVIKYAARQRRDAVRERLYSSRAQQIEKASSVQQSHNHIGQISENNPMLAARMMQKAQTHTEVEKNAQKKHPKLLSQIPEKQNSQKQKTTRLQSIHLSAQQTPIAQQEKLRSMDVLFGKSQRKLHEAEDAKTLIAKINDSEDYEKEDDS